MFLPSTDAQKEIQSRRFELSTRLVGKNTASYELQGASEFYCAVGHLYWRKVRSWDLRGRDALYRPQPQQSVSAAPRETHPRHWCSTAWPGQEPFQLDGKCAPEGGACVKSRPHMRVSQNHRIQKPEQGPHNAFVISTQPWGSQGCPMLRNPLQSPSTLGGGRRPMIILDLVPSFV